MSARPSPTCARAWVVVAFAAACSAPQGNACLAGGTDSGLPALGLYSLKIDGGIPTLLLDTGTSELSHPRRLNGTEWVVATRYARDPDGNGLAMEDEDGFGAYYDGTQIIAFALNAPGTSYVLAGTPTAGVAANPSWTEDGRVLYLHADPGGAGTELRRLSLSLTPSPKVEDTQTLSLPEGVVFPVDPHQTGPSDAAGRITFSALVYVTTGTQPGWAGPVLMIPASGTASANQLHLIGCPICPAQGGCCTFPQKASVLGTNDSRISHSAGEVTWMQRHPAISVDLGGVTLNPFRQVKAPLDGGPQVDLVQSGIHPMTLHAYPEWSPDDSTLAYWTIEFTTGVPRYHLELMSPDGRNRRRLPLLPDLCPQHPAFLDGETTIFNARRAKAGANSSCDVKLMRPG